MNFIHIADVHLGAQPDSTMPWGRKRADEIWLQDADAVTSEMELVRDYDLAGAAAWKIGFESSPQIWEIIRDHLQ